jgi:hypothetical protein
VTFDLSGTSNPPAFIGNQPAATYDPPSTLIPLTVYYWKAVARDSRGGVAPGPVWSFTTGLLPNNPPSAPASPSPAAGATGVLVTANVSWAGGVDPDGDPVTFDVYFGTTNPPAFVGSTEETTYNPPGDLAYSTVHYWKIVTKDDRGGETAGPVWSFTTEAAPNSPPSAPASPSPADAAIVSR